MAPMRKIYCAVIVRACARSLPLPIGKSTNNKKMQRESLLLLPDSSGFILLPRFVWWFNAILIRQSLLIASHDFHICRRQNSRAMGEMYFAECQSQAMTLLCYTELRTLPGKTGFSSFSPLIYKMRPAMLRQPILSLKGGYIYF